MQNDLSRLPQCGCWRDSVLQDFGAQQLMKGELEKFPKFNTIKICTLRWACNLFNIIKFKSKSLPKKNNNKKLEKQKQKIPKAQYF